MNKIEIKEAVLREAPPNWETLVHNNGYSMIKVLNISKYCDEFSRVEKILNGASTSQLRLPTIREITRVQSIADYGQFLLRRQILSIGNPTSYYEVRMFYCTSYENKDNGIIYNLDYRRMKMFTNITLKQTIDNMALDNKVLFIVKAITSSPRQSIMTPEHSNNFYIEYVITF